jgi:hypothetical protein
MSMSTMPYVESAASMSPVVKPPALAFTVALSGRFSWASR